MKKNIILSRYNEDVSWVFKNLDCFEKIFIADKGHDLKLEENSKIIVYKLPNVGRESHTYLHFIQTFYEFINNNKEDLFIFSQAFPFDVNLTFINDINNINTNSSFPLTLSKASNYENVYAHLGLKDASHPNGIPYINYFNRLFFDEYLGLSDGDRRLVKYSGLWAVPASNILFRNITFYNNCQNLLKEHINPFEGYIFERMWEKIFDGKTLDWDSHYDKIREKYASGFYKTLKVG